jgi:hypothetical protein
MSNSDFNNLLFVLVTLNHCFWSCLLCYIQKHIVTASLILPRLLCTMVLRLSALKPLKFSRCLSCTQTVTRLIVVLPNIPHITVARFQVPHPPHPCPTLPRPPSLPKLPQPACTAPPRRPRLSCPHQLPNCAPHCQRPSCQ